MKIEIRKYGSTGLYTDITDYIANKGVTWSFNSVDADGAGRSLDGIMHRKQIAIKNKLEFQCRPLTSTEVKTLRTLLANEWLDIKFTDNAEVTTFKGYRGANISTAVLISHNNKDMWGGLKFSCIEG